VDALASDGYLVEPWDRSGTVRMVAAFDTEAETVDGLLAGIRRRWPARKSGTSKART
jgi:hypothetical protein